MKDLKQAGRPWSNPRLAVVAISAAAALAAAGCGSSRSDSSGGGAATGASTASSSTTSSARKANIAVFVPSLTSYTQPYVTYLRSHYGSQADFVVFNGDFQATKQVQQCQDALSAGKYQAFLIQPADGGPLVPCVKQAIAKGVKVAGVSYPPIGADPLSKDIQVPGLTGQVLLSADGDPGAAVALAKKACAGASPCKVMMLEAVPTFGFTAVKRRQELALFKKDPSIKVVNESVIGFTAPAKAQSAVATQLQKNPDLKVVLGDDDGSLPGVINALASAGKADQVKIIGDGGNRQTVKDIVAGKVFGTIVSLPVSGASVATQMLLDAIAGRTIAQPTQFVPDLSKACPDSIIDQSCAAQFRAEW
jgi:ribose transport system substrate-binding protein